MTFRRRLILLGAILLGGTLFYFGSFAFDYGAPFRKHDPLIATDNARLDPVRVAAVDRLETVEALQVALVDARAKGLKVSMAGSHHSQGGQTYTAGGVQFDMRGFRKILAIDTVAQTITVESGATWDEVQRALAPVGLAIKVMQSSNIFTVAGTMSANAHGRDLDVMQVVEVVERFHLLLADGSVVEVSRTENPELFALVIGGYGMYGVILDVTLKVTKDELYEQHATSMDYKAFPAYFSDSIKSDPGVVLMLVRPSIDPDPDKFLREMVVVTWRRAPAGTPGSFALTEEANVTRDRFFLGISRKFNWAKKLRWWLQKKVELGAGSVRVVSRNNAMRPPLAPLELLRYQSGKDTDILNEYYVPMQHFVPFMDRFRQILLDNQMNVMSSTVRYVSPNDTPVLAYAPTEPVFAIIQMSNVGLDSASQAKTADVTRQLVDAAIEYGGTYYLTYQLYPTPAQLYRAYPRAGEAFERKRFYDPGEVFSSKFYERYGHAEGQ